MSLITLFVPGSVILLRLPLVSSINPLLSSNLMILPGILTQVPRHTWRPIRVIFSLLLLIMAMIKLVLEMALFCLSLLLASRSFTHFPHNFREIMSSYFRKIYWLYCSVWRFCLDNDCVIEFSPFGFCVKDRRTRQSLFKCNNPGLLYPFFPTDASVEAAYFCLNPTLWLQGLAHLNSHTLICWRINCLPIIHLLQT